MRRPKPGATSTVLGFLLSVTSGALQAQAPPALHEGPWAERIDALEAELPGLMEEAGLPGLSIAVVSAEDIWVRQLGVLRVDDEERVRGTTLFEAASLSKPVFAYALQRLVDRGDLELDEPLSDSWHYADLADDPRGDAVTTRIVLSHRTGLPNWGGRPLEFQFAPGTKYQYSGEGYVWVQKTVAAALGRELPDLAREEVFGPLHMTRSSYSFDGSDPDHARPHHTQGHTLDKRLAAEPGNAAASLHTTADDFGRFLQAVLREEGLAAGSLARISEHLTDVEPGVGWGLGWGLEYPDSRAEPALWHWGDNGPFKAFTYLDPVEGIGFVFFANSTHGLAITRRVLTRLFPGGHPVLGWLQYDQIDD